MTRFYIIVLAFVIFLPVANVRAQGGKLGIGFSVTAQKLYGDTRSGDVVFGGNPLLLRFNFTRSLFLDGDFGFSRLRASVRGGTQTSRIFHFGLKAGYRFRPAQRLNPLVYLGFGILNFRVANSPYYWDGYGAVGGGAEYFLTPSFGLNTSLDFRYTSGDDFDGGSLAAGKDGFFNFAVGLNYYFKANDLKKEPAGLNSENQELLSPIEEVSTEVEPETVSSQNRAAFEHEIMMAEQENLLKELEKRNEILRLLQTKNAVMSRYLKQLNEAGLHSGTTFKHLSGEIQNALFLYASGEHEAATRLLTRLIDEEEDPVILGNLWFWLGENHFASGNYKAAVSAFQNAGQNGISHPRSLTNQMMLGLSKIKNGEPSAGYTILRQVLKEDLPREYEDLINDYVAEIELRPDFQL